MRDNETRSMWLSDDTEVEIGYEYLDPERTVVLTQYDTDHHITGQIRFAESDASDMIELLNAVKSPVITAEQIKATTITGAKIRDIPRYELFPPRRIFTGGVLYEEVQK